MEEQSNTVRINDNFAGFYYTFLIVVIAACIVVGVIFLQIAFSEDPDAFSSIIPEGLAILVSIVPATLIFSSFKPKVLRKFFLNTEELGFWVPSKPPFTIKWQQFDNVHFQTFNRSQIGTSTEFRFIDSHTNSEQTFGLYTRSHFRTWKFAEILYVLKYNMNLQKKTMVATINDKKLKRILAQLYELQIFGHYSSKNKKQNFIPGVVKSCGFRPQDVKAGNTPSFTPEISVEALEKAIESDPENGMIWQQLGDAYYTKGLYDLASEALNEAYKVSTNWFLNPPRVNG